jgi:hypothetical protein
LPAPVPAPEPLGPVESLEPLEPPVALEEEHPASDRTMARKPVVIFMPMLLEGWPE